MMMRKKILYLFGYLLLASVSLFSLILDITSLIQASFESPQEKFQMIVFAIIFGIIFIISLLLFVSWLFKVLNEIRIVKENK